VGVWGLCNEGWTKIQAKKSPVFKRGFFEFVLAGRLLVFLSVEKGRSINAVYRHIEKNQCRPEAYSE
jgi:hypothetical protein